MDGFENLLGLVQGHGEDFVVFFGFGFEVGTDLLQFFHFLSYTLGLLTLLKNY